MQNVGAFFEKFQFLGIFPPFLFLYFFIFFAIYIKQQPSIALQYCKIEKMGELLAIRDGNFKFVFGDFKISRDLLLFFIGLVFGSTL